MWWQEAVVYQIYPRSFKDSNGDGIGDLNGIIEKLDYLKGSKNSLGVDAIWLSPINTSPMVDFGYDISDYNQIDPIFGDLPTFQKLIEEARKRDIKIIMDLVVNHTSDQHPWFIESRSSKNNPKRDWYIWKDPVNEKEPNNWLGAFGGKAWELDPKTGQYYLHSFTKEQPDLNWRNPGVKEAIFSMVKYWLNMGVAGFRLDVVNCFIKDDQFRSNRSRFFWGMRALRPYDRQVHEFDRDRQETHSILKELRKILDSYLEPKMSVGEVFLDPPGNPKIPALYYGKNSDELHLAFNFTLVFSKWNAKKFKEAIQQWDKILGEENWPTYVLSNHDFYRHISRYANKRDTLSRAKVAAILLLTMRGTPFLYYGEEIGMMEQTVPRKKIQDPVGKRYWPFYKGRDGARGPMCWNEEKFAGFSTVEPWLPIFKKYRKINVAKQLEDQNSLFYIYKEMLSLRKDYKTLVYGKVDFKLPEKGDVLCYIREYQQERILILLNFSSKPIVIENIRVMADKGKILFSTHRKSDIIIELENLSLSGNEGTVILLWNKS